MIRPSKENNGSGRSEDKEEEAFIMKILKLMYEFCLGFETRTDTLKHYK